MEKIAASLLENAADGIFRARLLAVSTKESGTWLHALSIFSDLRMDDNTIRVIVGLHLGSALYRLHSCQYCGVEVDHLANHGLRCKKSEDRHYHHAAISDIFIVLYHLLGPYQGWNYQVSTDRW